MLHKIIILILIVILTCGKFPFPKKIWLYWDSNIQQAPISILLCYNKLKSVAEKQSFTLTLLSQQNLAQHLERYDEFLKIKRNAKTPWKQNIADLVRLMILQQEGGIYLDISSVLIYGLKWLQEIQDFEYLLTNVQEGVQPDLLVPYIHFYQSTSGQRGYKGTILNEQPGFQVWFIASKPKTPAITQWLKWYSHFYQMNLSQKVPIYTQEDIYFRNIEGSQYLNANKAIYYFLQRKQVQLDKNITLFSSRTLAVNHYKIWGFKGEYGPFVFYLRLVPEQSYLFTKTVNELSQQFVRLHFYIKLTQSDRLYIQQMLGYQQSQVIEKKISFQEFFESSPKAKHCREMVFPYEGSIVANLLADNQVTRQKKYLILSKEEAHSWEKYCQNLLREEQMENALKNLFETFKYVVESINGEPISASISKPYETQMYEKNDLSLFDYLLIWWKNNIFGLKIFMHYSIGLLLIGFTFKIMSKYLSNSSVILSLFNIPNEKAQKISKPGQQLSGFSSILVYLLFATNTFIIAMFHLFERLGDVHEQYFLLKVIVWRYVLLILIEERIHQKDQVWFGIRLDEYMMTINVVIEFCLTKMVLFNIQKRQNMLGSHAIFIGMMCPYILKLYNKLGSSSQTKYSALDNPRRKNKHVTQFNESIQTYTPVITILFLLFCLITNLKHVTYGQHYFVRSLIYPIIAFVIFVTIKLIIKLWKSKNPQKNRGTILQGNNEYEKYENLVIASSIALISWFSYSYYYNFNEWSLDWGNAYGVDKFLINYFIVISINLLKPINEHSYLQSTKSKLLIFIIRTLLPFAFPLLLNIQFKVDHLGILGGFQKWMPYTVFIMILNRLSQRKQEIVHKNIQNLNSEQQLQVINSQKVSDNFIV